MRHSLVGTDALVEALPVPVLLLGPQQTIRLHNGAATRHLGYASDELDGMDFCALLPPGDAPLAQLLEGGHETVAARSRWDLRRADGAYTTVHLGPVVEFEGQPMRLLWGVPAATDRLGDSVFDPDDLASFAFSAFHDLKEPLQLVKGYLRMAQQPLEPDEQQAHVATAMAATERMQALVLSLLEYFRIRSTTPQAEPCDTQQILHEVLDTLQLRIAESGARIEAGPLPPVQGDRSQLVRLFQNLISNAIKFHGPGAPQVHVGNHAGVFHVMDDGIGVPASEREAVFEPFHRLHSVDRFPGSGLGLSTCRGIVERHGGRIWIDPVPGGTAVRFTLGAAR